MRPVRDRATFAALTRARRHRAGGIWVRCAPALPSVAPSVPRVGYAITRASGSAVERNRIRRRLRAAVAQHEGDLVSGCAYLFGADRRLLHAPFSSIDRAVGELLRACREVDG